MENKKLLKKDWQLLTAHSLMTILAFQRTIIENQAFIISELTKTLLSEVTAKTNEYIKDNMKVVNDMVDKNIPTYLETEKLKY